MLLRDQSDDGSFTDDASLTNVATPSDDILPTYNEPPALARTSTETPTRERSVSSVASDATGLAAFAGRWQMNDFLFLLVYENLKPAAKSDLRSQTSTDSTRRFRPSPWFVVTTSEWRRAFVDTVAGYTSVRPKQIPFLVARFVTASVFLLLAIRFAIQAADSDNPVAWIRAAFLTIAWFWLLLPTQNPWYWTWALAFVPFARSRVWLAMSGLTLIYYARFWFAYHGGSTHILGTPYMGVEFFDFVVTWIEFFPWLIWLLCVSIRQRNPTPVSPGHRLLQS